MAAQSGKLARRYAKAFLGVVESSLGRDGSPTPAQNVARSLEQIAAAWETDPELSLFLLNPMYRVDERVAAAVAVAKEFGLPEVALSFVRVLVERDRLRILPDIAATYAELADDAAGVMQVEVTTASQIDAAEVNEIEQSFRSAVSGTPVFSWKVDPQLIGGMAIRFRGTVIDGSIQGQLERIERGLQS